MKKQKYFLILFGIICIWNVNAQGKFAVKSNLLYDLTSTINLGIETALAPQWTLDISGNYNPWSFSDNKKMKHWMIQPEARYWLCEKFNGHFFGLHAHYAEYNVGGINLFSFKNYRYEGKLYGAGLTYGYQWILSNRWSIEGALGVGYSHLDRDKYNCEKCGAYIDTKKKNYIGPTKASISIIYIIK